MTEEQLQEIEQCWARSTHGVWQVANVNRINKLKPSRVTVHAFREGDPAGVCVARDLRYVETVRGEGCDAELIVMAHERIPALVAEVKRLRRTLKVMANGKVMIGDGSDYAKGYEQASTDMARIALQTLKGMPSGEACCANERANDPWEGVGEALDDDVPFDED